MSPTTLDHIQGPYNTIKVMPLSVAEMEELCGMKHEPADTPVRYWYLRRVYAGLSFDHLLVAENDTLDAVCCNKDFFTVHRITLVPRSETPWSLDDEYTWGASHLTDVITFMIDPDKHSDLLRFPASQ